MIENDGVNGDQPTVCAHELAEPARPLQLLAAGNVVVGSIAKS